MVIAAGHSYRVTQQNYDKMPAEVMDTLFGTRYHTPGAALQLPRKVPMRVEPKSYFGERCCYQPHISPHMAALIELLVCAG